MPGSPRAPHLAGDRPRALQRIDRFVGRTTNWLYDHLRCVARHEPIVLCDVLDNRAEFPELEARRRDGSSPFLRLWRRIMHERPDPAEARWLRQRRPTLLHSHFGYVAAGDFGLRDFLDVPWVVSFYGADVYELGLSPVWRAEYARMFARVDLVLALGPQMALRLEALGCPASKLVVHPLGVSIGDIPYRERQLEPGATLEVLFAGTFREKKGVEYLIRGAAEARRRGVRLHLTLVGDAAGKVGDAETKAAIFREIQRLDLQDVVTHHPWLSFHDLMAVSLASHVFVAPSVTSATGDAEGTPFVLQQMMASGIPVVATTHSDIPFIFGECQNQLLPERDAGAIARRLEEYAHEPGRLVADGRLLADRIGSAFDVRIRAAALSDLYDAVCGVASGASTGATMAAAAASDVQHHASPVSVANRSGPSNSRGGVR